MNKRNEQFLLVTLPVLILLVALARAGGWTAAAAPLAEQISAAAARFLAALSPDERARLTFALDDEERFNWHYIPRARAGIPLKAMTAEQRTRAHALVAEALSSEGYQTAKNIMLLDQVLFELQGRNPIRDPEAYYFTFFGAPAETQPWGWRLEGHHLSLNFTHGRGGALSVAPAFFGANPATVREGPQQGLRTLAAEEDKGRALLRMFGGDQRQKVLLGVEAPADIITGVSRRADVGPPAGLPVAEMTAAQSRALLELVELYARRMRPELAEAELAKIRRADVEKIHFAWAGGSEPGQPHYYRLHGPAFVIEYDNTQDNANHIHTVWRDFEGDFGLDLLREHYARSPHHARPAIAVPKAARTGH
ncbi:MAG: DUF3500 domain-containing protein [Candidatus Acidiferrales bacterium]